MPPITAAVNALRPITTVSYTHLDVYKRQALKGLKNFPLLSGDLTFAADGSREGGGFVIVEPTGDGGAFVLKDDLS